MGQPSILLLYEIRNLTFHMMLRKINKTYIIIQYQYRHENFFFSPHQMLNEHDEIIFKFLIDCKCAPNMKGIHDWIKI